MSKPPWQTAVKETMYKATDFIENGRPAGWQTKTVASMHTEPARRAARARLTAYNRLWDELETELNGDDLVENGRISPEWLPND